jgi:hypothetical protein
MANPSDPIALNIRGVTDLVENDVNKIQQGDNVNMEGAQGEKYGVLSLRMSDAQLIKLKKEWEDKYAPYEAKIKPLFERNKESYLGKKADGQWLNSDGTPIAANLQFEAEETFLAAALAKNPEPVVYSDDTPEGDMLAKSVRTMLQYHSDTLVLKRKMGFMVRQWSIYHLGVLKHGWNATVRDVEIQNRKIQNFIFDPNGYVDAYGDFVGYLGERISVTAERLIELFPDHAEYISQTVEGRLGTEVLYTEWWSADDKFTFTTYKEKVLDKHVNPYFKYPEPQVDPLTGQPMMGDDGQPVLSEARNHFAAPKKPYTFLSVFSLQERPHDITGLIEQNIPNQNRISRRTEQIDYNASAANNSFAFSMDNFDQETAKQAADARRKGNPILVPSGAPIADSLMPLNAQDLPAAVFNELEIAKNDLRLSWGINGITSMPQDEDQTARGMILNQQNDTTRIGGGIGDAIEQVADNVFNWLVQLYYVFYDEPHFAAVIGNAKAVEYVTLQNSDLNRQLIISVSPDSMRPRDEITEINMAQALFDKGAIGPKTLLKMLSFPNPDEAAADGVLYKIDPMAYMQLNFPDFAAQLQASQQQQAMQQMQNEAQGTMMNAQAQAAGTPPEAQSEPEKNVSKNPANAGLDQVKLPPL